MTEERQREARKNLQMLVEAYLREESSMRWGATAAQIRAAAKKMVDARQIPQPLAMRLRERYRAIRQQGASSVF